MFNAGLSKAPLVRPQGARHLLRWHETNISPSKTKIALDGSGIGEVKNNLFLTTDPVADQVGKLEAFNPTS